MKLELINFSDEIQNSVLTKTFFSVSNRIFGYSFNSKLIHQVVSSCLMNKHSGTKSQKNRALVSGSNRKPWKQKGTGRARAGSVKSPIWRSGGVTFAAQPIKKFQKINKKMYRGAIRSILSKLVSDKRLFLIENLFLKKSKTKFLLEKLGYIIFNNRVLIVTNQLNKNLILASRNLHMVNICNVSEINPINLINCHVVLIERELVAKIEDRFI